MQVRVLSFPLSAFTTVKVKVNMKKIVVNFWMVVFCLAAICFVLPVIVMLPFLMASAISAVCAGLLRKLSKVS